MLANIFVSFCETKIAKEDLPELYHRYVDTFSIFENQDIGIKFFHILNNLHPTLRFTMENESENRLHEQFIYEALTAV